MIVFFPNVKHFSNISIENIEFRYRVRSIGLLKIWLRFVVLYNWILHAKTISYNVRKPYRGLEPTFVVPCYILVAMAALFTRPSVWSSVIHEAQAIIHRYPVLTYFTFARKNVRRSLGSIDLHENWLAEFINTCVQHSVRSENDTRIDAAAVGINRRLRTIR